MINEEVERRIASYYMGITMSEHDYNALVGALIDAIWETDEQITDDELVNIGVMLINSMIIKREEESEK